MNKIAEEIKDILTLKLAELGMSVMDFEKSLHNLNTGEGVLKVADTLDGVSSQSPLPAAAAGYALAGRGGNKSSGNLYTQYGLPLTVGAGIMGGTILSRADNDLEDLNSSLDSERKKIDYLRNLKRNLEVEHGIHNPRKHE